MSAESIYEGVKSFLKLKKVAGTYGIEIETETTSESNYPDGFFVKAVTKSGKAYLKTPMLPMWHATYDNSLRHFGIEFVLDEPLSFKKALEALDEFAAATKSVKFIQNSPATSVHIHWNISAERFLTLANFSASYALYENILLMYCGPTRRSNLFALPMRVCESIPENIIKMLNGLSRGSHGHLRFDPNQTKYGAYNPCNMTTLGSLEIRPMRGTSNMSEVKEWLSILNQMVEYSRVEKLTPLSILKMQEVDPDELFGAVFGKYANILRKAAGTDFDLLIDKNLWYLKEIATSVKKWDQFDSCMDEAIKAHKEMIEAASKPSPIPDGDLMEYAMKLAKLPKKKVVNGQWVDSWAQYGAGTMAEQNAAASPPVAPPVEWGWNTAPTVDMHLGQLNQVAQATLANNFDEVTETAEPEFNDWDDDDE